MSTKITIKQDSTISAKINTTGIKSKIYTDGTIKADINAQGSSQNLTTLTDTTITSPENGDAIIYEDNKWVNHQLTTSKVLDIDNTNKTDGALLVYQSSNEKYNSTNILNNQNTQIVGGSF